MQLLRPLGRWTTTTLRAVMLAATIAGVTHFATAQTVPATGARSQAAMPKRIYTKNAEFKLPIQMDDKSRAAVDRVCLYVKCGDAAWVRQDTGPASMPYFLYHVPQDGEYLFSLTTIDKTGRMSPPDVSLEPPALRVLVDTKAPVLDISPWTSPQGEICLRCNVVDANPDPNSLKVVAKTPAGDRVLAPYPGQPGVFKSTGPEMVSASLVVTASDLAGNQAMRQVRLSDMLQAAQPQAPAATTVSAKVDIQPAPKAELPAPKTELPAPPPLPIIPLADSLPVTLPPPAPCNNPPMPAANHSASNASAVIHPALNPSANARPDVDAPPRLPAPTTAAGGGDRHLINTTRAALDYRVDHVGPSGVGKVEVYMTSDDGQTWRRLAEDHDRRSPVEFDLPGEGVFGIRLAVTNGNGFGGTPPKRGDRPLYSIEVDTSAPFVQLRPIEPMVTSGALEIRWQASDKNLGAEPISLHYRSRNEGPWQLIARGLKNDGSYRWTFPRDVAGQFFVKVEVTDLAGNTARAETPNPIVLDTTEPQATVTGVSALSTRPGGN